MKRHLDGNIMLGLPKLFRLLKSFPEPLPMPLHLSSSDGYLHTLVSGVFHQDALRELAELVAQVANSYRQPPHRLIDITGLTAIEVSFHDLWSLAQQCRLRPSRAPVKTAIVAQQPVQVGYARMYQRINDYACIAVFGSSLAARDWLTSAELVDPELIGVVEPPAPRPRLPVPEWPAATPIAPFAPQPSQVTVHACPPVAGSDSAAKTFPCP